MSSRPELVPCPGYCYTPLAGRCDYCRSLELQRLPSSTWDEPRRFGNQRVSKPQAAVPSEPTLTYFKGPYGPTKTPSPLSSDGESDPINDATKFKGTFRRIKPSPSHIARSFLVGSPLSPMGSQIPAEGKGESFFDHPTLDSDPHSEFQVPEEQIVTPQTTQEDFSVNALIEKPFDLNEFRSGLEEFEQKRMEMVTVYLRYIEYLERRLTQVELSYGARLIQVELSCSSLGRGLQTLQHALPHWLATPMLSTNILASQQPLMPGIDLSVPPPNLYFDQHSQSFGEQPPDYGISQAQAPLSPLYVAPQRRPPFQARGSGAGKGSMV